MEIYENAVIILLFGNICFLTANFAFVKRRNTRVECDRLSMSDESMLGNCLNMKESGNLCPSVKQ